MTRATLAAFAASALLACASQEQDQAASAAPAPAITSLTLEAGNVWLGSSGYTDRTRLVIRTPAEWAGAWATLWARVNPVPDLPAVDFDREVVILAAMGRRSTGGYAILLTDAAVTSAGHLIVSVTESSPGVSCATGQAESEPATAVVLRGTPAVVEFSETAVVHECQ